MSAGRAGDPELAAEFESYLRPGEQLRWCGRPDPAVLFTPGDGMWIPFSVFWLGFSGFWVTGVSVTDGADGLLGVPFLLCGFYMVAGRFLVKRVRKRQTSYGVTRDRALRLYRGGCEEFALTGPRRVVHGRGGHVSVIFGPPYASWYRAQTLGARRGPSPNDFGPNTGMNWRGQFRPFAFYDVADGRELLAALDRSWPDDWESVFASR
jgi:hypothetical protein